LRLRHSVLLALLCLPSLSAGADNRWHWVKVGNNVDHGWDISRGDAIVVVQNAQFTATLFWEGSTTDVQITLKGNVASGKLTVKEVVQGSDYSGSTYGGTMNVKKWPATGGTTGVETINLSDGLGTIGLTRTIRK